MANELFFAPTELQEACALLADPNRPAVALAGGTDLMVRYNRHRKKRSEALVYLGKLGLEEVREESGRLLVGGCATFEELAASEAVARCAPILAAAAADMASPAVRSAATLGGNVANNARAADGVAALLALGAEAVISSAKGEKRLGMEEYLSTPRRQTLADGGVITRFEIPCLDGQERWAWHKLRQRKGESRSILTVSARLRLEGGKCAEVRLVLGGMAANPFVSQKAKEILEGRSLEPELIERVASEVIAETDPVDDVRATAWYRQRAAKALVARVLTQMA
jgi:CO/xanthine dehydrogenase FAD-binding subunit